MQILASKAVAGKRRDPKPRHVDGAPRWNRTPNADPGRKYVWVDLHDRLVCEQYERDGFEVETHRKSGPMDDGRASALAKKYEGQQVEAMGCVLMSVPLERWEQIKAEGPDGGRGAELAQRKEDEMLRPPGMREHDPSRGRHGGRSYVRRDGLEVVSESKFEGAEH